MKKKSLLIIFNLFLSSTALSEVPIVCHVFKSKPEYTSCMYRCKAFLKSIYNDRDQLTIIRHTTVEMTDSKEVEVCFNFNDNVEEEGWEIKMIAVLPDPVNCQ